MQPIQRELDRVKRALWQLPAPARHAQLYVAQQALAWAMEPERFASPMDVIEREAVWAFG